MEPTVPLGFARAVLHGETDDGRFERFCCDLIQLIEGDAVIVTTSASWDRGRDGRSIGPGPRVLVCASITTAITDKMRGDLKKIADSQAKVARVYFCTTQDPSEHTLDQVAAEIQASLPGVQIDPQNATQLARVAGFKAEPLERHYATELRDLRVFLTTDATIENDVAEALMLALATAGNQQSSEIRSAAYRQLLLRSLSDTQARTLNEICVDVSTRLKLARPIPVSAITVHLDELCVGNLVENKDKTYLRLSAGAAAVVDDEEAAAASLKEGRRDIRLTLESSLGQELPDPQFDSIWALIERKLTEFFATQGLRMVETISKIAQSKIADGAQGEERTRDEQDTLPFFVEALAETVAATSEMAEQRAELKQAIKDLFSERTGPAYEWIGSVCASFVLVCMLGLEETTGSRLREAIAGTYLIPDTDIVLEYVGDGEPEHRATQQLIREWQRLGGHVLLAAPVAEEVAYHAWISERDYEEARNRFLRTEEDRRLYVRNVFVRSFGHVTEHKKLRPSDWNSYINDFRGKSADDTSSIDELLIQDDHFDRLPDDDLRESPGKELEKDLTESIDRGDLAGRDRRIALDKARRDARLYASMVHFGEKLRQGHKSGTCVLVTSSGRLQEIGATHANSNEQTLSLAGAIYLLSMVPGVTLGRAALHSILFDGRLLHREHGLDLLVLRAVRDSGHVFPRARRTKLTRHVRSRLIELARERGNPALKPDSIAATVEHDPEAKAVLSSAIADGLDRIAATSPLERENDELRRRVRELEVRLSRR